MPSSKLIGTELDQVSANADLGTMAFQSAENVLFTDGRGGLGHLDLTAISKQTSDTIVKVFVYDTSKDSDGGAWRKRTQNTSWYNEPLNTPTRGSRAEFPGVAVIVITSNTMTIYDGDDPQMPMWMVFLNDGVLSWGTAGTATLKAMTAINGYLLVVTENVGGLLFNFAGDDTRTVYSANYSLTNVFRQIGNRNLTTNVTPLPYTSTGAGLDGYVLYSGSGGYQLRNCASTVLPNAPIDPKSQLPKPTFAIACGVSGGSGGVAVIRHDDTVLAGIKANDSWNCEFVVFDKNNVLWSAEGFDSGYGGLQIMSYPPYTKVEGIGVGSLGFTQAIAPYTFYGTDVTWPKLLGGGIRAISRDGDGIATGHTHGGAWTTGGITKVVDDPLDHKATLMAYLGVDYVTGWMPGPAAGAWLTSVQSGSLIPTNLVSNSTLSTTTNWSTYASTLSSNGSVGTATATSTALYGANIGLDNLVVGQAYTIQADVTTSNATPNIRIQMSGLGLRYSSGAMTTSGSATIKDTFVANSTSMILEILEYGTHAAGATFTFDNVICKIAENDRTENMFGAEISGIITKYSAVQGSDVQAYTNFNTSAGNKLIVPYFKDLNQSSWTMMVWYNSTAAAGEQIPMGFGTANSSSQYRGIYVSGGYMGFAGWSNDFVSSRFVDDGTWHLLAISAIHLGSNGYSISLFVDGELVGQKVLGLVDYTTRTLDIGGAGIGGDRHVKGSISLARVVSYPVAHDTMRRIYADESELFTPEAKATIYGGNKEIISHGLAFDEDTNQLHAITTSGRSSFIGLRRVDYTTNTLANSVHAANGLVVEA